MKLFRFIRNNSLVAVAAVLLTACGTQANQSSDATSNSPTAEPTGPTVDPSVEPTGQPEKPQQPGGGAPTIPVPTLPIGGSGPEPTIHQCVVVSWLESSAVIPKNWSVRVKAIRFSDAGLFDKADSGCDGNPGCAGFVFTAARTQCSVPVTARQSHGGSTSLLLSGEVRCPAGQEGACRDFAKKVSGGSIPLTQPEGPVSPDEQPPSSGTPPTS
jgi:hypothetical protein